MGWMTRGSIITGHFRILKWRYLPYLRPIFQAYVREYPHKIWPYMVQYLQFNDVLSPWHTFARNKPCQCREGGGCETAKSFSETDQTKIAHIVDMTHLTTRTLGVYEIF